jgi:hypothetical protein
MLGKSGLTAIGMRTDLRLWHGRRSTARGPGSSLRRALLLRCRRHLRPLLCLQSCVLLLSLLLQLLLLLLMLLRLLRLQHLLHVQRLLLWVLHLLLLWMLQLRLLLQWRPCTHLLLRLLLRCRRDPPLGKLRLLHLLLHLHLRPRGP